MTNRNEYGTGNRIAQRDYYETHFRGQLTVQQIAQFGIKPCPCCCEKIISPDMSMCPFCAQKKALEKGVQVLVCSIVMMVFFYWLAASIGAEGVWRWVITGFLALVGIGVALYCVHKAEQGGGR